MFVLLKEKDCPSWVNSRKKKKEKVIADLERGKNFLENGLFFFGHTCVIRMAKHLEGKDHHRCLVY